MMPEPMLSMRTIVPAATKLNDFTRVDVSKRKERNIIVAIRIEAYKCDIARIKCQGRFLQKNEYL
jgi:hypothetical protein